MHEPGHQRRFVELRLGQMLPAINGGTYAHGALSVLPVGLLQAWASVELAIVSPITHPAQRVHDVRLHEFRRSRITRNADREFNKMDYFVVKSLRNWQFRRGGQRPTRRKP